jgi:tetratricopeptide (TPR) repeat protein
MYTLDDDIENPALNETHFALHAYDKRLSHFCALIKKQLKKTLQRSSLLLVLYLGLLCLQFALILTYLTTYFVGIFLTSFFVSLFLIFPYYYFLKAKKNQKMHFLLDEFTKMCCGQVQSMNDTQESLFVISYGTLLLKTKIASLENQVFEPPKWLFFFQDFLSILSKALHASDLFYFQELALKKSKQSRIELIQMDPQNSKYHVKLALIFLEMANFYSQYDESKKEKKSLLLAEQELKIVIAYNPSDVWGYSQLASCYARLNNTKNQIKVLEKLVCLTPNKSEVLKNLGTLYFQMGKNKKGLEIFERLKEQSNELAKEMLKFFGAVND